MAASDQWSLFLVVACESPPRWGSTPSKTGLFAETANTCQCVQSPTLFHALVISQNHLRCIAMISTCTVPLKNFATTAKHQTPLTPLGGFGAAGRLEPSVASRQTPSAVGEPWTNTKCRLAAKHQVPSVASHQTSNDVLKIERGHARHDLKIHAHHYWHFVWTKCGRRVGSGCRIGST